MTQRNGLNRTSLLVAVSLVLGGILPAQQKKTTTPAPAKPAAPAPAAKAPAAPAAPAAHAAGASTSTVGRSATTTTTSSHGLGTGATTTTAGKGPTTTTSSATTNRTTTTPATTANPRGATTSATTTNTRSTTGTPAAAGHLGGPAEAGRGPNVAGGAARGALGAPGHPSPDAIRAAGPMGGHPAPMGGRELHSEHGLVRTRADGRPMDLHDARRGEDIHHNLYGGRRVVMERPGGGRAYYERGRPGYLGHPYRAHGYDFNRRTYYYHGRVYDRYYRPYPYHGYALDVYTPARYYRPGFYGWAYNPWAAPVRYSWGWGGNPWYGYYGGYFTPYPVYATPSLWLTDYMISQSLADAYTAQQEAGGAAPGQYAGPPLSPDVKDMISQEVQRDIALENNEAQQNAAQQVSDPASSSINRLFTDGQPHVFVADKEVDVVAANGQECAITDGDVITMRTPPGPQDTTVNVTVMAAKGAQDCPTGSQVAVGIDDLSEMHNHLRETVDRGLEELAKKQGTGGLPAAPPSAAPTQTTQSLVADGAPPPDPNGAKELETLATQSTKDESDLMKDAGGGPSAAPVTQDVPAAAAAAVPAQSVSLEKGQTLDQVQQALGTPTKVVKMGTKTLYYFGDTKVTMVAGKVTSVD